MDLPPDIALALANHIAADPTGYRDVGPLLARIAHDLESRVEAAPMAERGGGRAADAPVAPALQSHQDDSPSPVVSGKAFPDARRSFVAGPRLATARSGKVSQSACEALVCPLHGLASFRGQQ